MFSSKWFVAAIAAMLGSLLLANQPVEAAPSNICTNTTITVTDNGPAGSGSISNGGTVADGDQLGIDGATFQSGSSGSGCIAGDGSSEVTDGSIHANVFAGAFNPATNTYSPATCTTTATDLGVVPETFDTTGDAGHTFAFQTHYQPTGGTGFHESKSPCLSLTVTQASCSSLDTVTITPSAASGDNPVDPKTFHSWSYTFKVQNCTPSNGLGIKVQGGAAGWLSSASAAGDGSCTTSPKNKNFVMTCFTTLNPNQIATITVNVSGTTPKSPDDNLSLSGIWSAVWTPTDGTQTGRTDAANNVTICSDSNILNCGP